MPLKSKQLISIILFVGFATSIFGQESLYRKKLFFGVEYNNEAIVDSTHYIFKLAKLYELKDDSLLLKKQLIRPNRKDSKFDRIYYWSAVSDIPSENTLVNYKKHKTKYLKKYQLPYESNSYFGTDPIFKSPFTTLWSPLRRITQHVDQSIGLNMRPLALTYFGYTPSALEGKSDVSSFFGAEIYSKWLIANTKKWGITSLTFELGYKVNLINENPDLGSSVGSNITSNVTVSNTAPIIGDISITQAFLGNKIFLTLGRLTPWYYYGYNSFTDDELTRTTNSMLNGGTNMPEGGGNSTKPGFGIKYMINTHFYFNFVMTNPKGADSDFDFTIYNPDSHFLASEVGYVYSFKNQLEGRLSFGIHHGLKKNVTDQSGYNGYGYNFLFQQELTPKGYTPYVGIYVQAGYSDPTISDVKQQYAMGMNIDHFIHRRNDGLGMGIGFTVPSNIEFRKEFFTDIFYRLQMTQSAQLTLDVQLIVNPANPAQQKGFAPIFSLRYLFVI